MFWDIQSTSYFLGNECSFNISESGNLLQNCTYYISSIYCLIPGQHSVAIISINHTAFPQQHRILGFISALHSTEAPVQVGGVPEQAASATTSHKPSRSSTKKAQTRKVWFDMFSLSQTTNATHPSPQGAETTSSGQLLKLPPDSIRSSRRE